MRRIVNHLFGENPKRRRPCRPSSLSLFISGMFSFLLFHRFTLACKNLSYLPMRETNQHIAFDELIQRKKRDPQYQPKSKKTEFENKSKVFSPLVGQSKDFLKSEYAGHERPCLLAGLLRDCFRCRPDKTSRVTRSRQNGSRTHHSPPSRHLKTAKHERFRRWFEIVEILFIVLSGSKQQLRLNRGFFQMRKRPKGNLMLMPINISTKGSFSILLFLPFLLTTWRCWKWKEKGRKRWRKKKEYMKIIEETRVP